MFAQDKLLNTDPLFFRDELRGEDAKNFSFDLDKINRCIDGIIDNHACIIYGEAGIGKSSFNWQILSILANKNARFKKSAFKRLNNQKFKCIFFKCDDTIFDIYDMMLNILRPSSETDSLSQVCNEVYEESEYQNQLTTQFSFNLLSLTKITFTSKNETKLKVNDPSDLQHYASLSSKQNVSFLFKDVMNKINKTYQNETVVIFIDEIQKVKNKDGLGTLIRDARNYKLIFIGIADTVGDIVATDTSSARNLIGGDIEIETLKKDQIEWIFRNAEEISNNRVRFDNSFIAKTERYSGGFPWIIQNLGFAAVKKYGNIALSKDEFIRISGDDFEEAIEEVIRVYKRTLENNLALDKAVSAPIRLQILLKLLETSLKQDPQELQKSFSAFPADRVKMALNKLVNYQILRKTSDNYYTFYNSHIRLFTRYYIDKSNKLP